MLWCAYFFSRIHIEKAPGLAYEDNGLEQAWKITFASVFGIVVVLDCHFCCVVLLYTAAMYWKLKILLFHRIVVLSTRSDRSYVRMRKVTTCIGTLNAILEHCDERDVSCICHVAGAVCGAR